MLASCRHIDQSTFWASINKNLQAVFEGLAVEKENVCRKKTFTYVEHVFKHVSICTLKIKILKIIFVWEGFQTLDF